MPYCRWFFPLLFFFVAKWHFSFELIHNFAEKIIYSIQFVLVSSCRAKPMFSKVFKLHAVGCIDMIQTHREEKQCSYLSCIRVQHSSSALPLRWLTSQKINIIFFNSSYHYASKNSCCLSGDRWETRICPWITSEVRSGLTGGKIIWKYSCISVLKEHWL